MASRPHLADGIAMMKPDEQFEVVHLMMSREKMEKLILQVLNEQYLGDDNSLVPRMITEILLRADDPGAGSGGGGGKGCWETLAKTNKKKVNEHW